MANKIYEEEIKKLGDKWFAGYYTSESDEEEQLVSAKAREEEKLLDDNGKEIIMELDADEMY